MAITHQFHLAGGLARGFNPVLDFVQGSRWRIEIITAEQGNLYNGCGLYHLHAYNHDIPASLNYHIIPVRYDAKKGQYVEAPTKTPIYLNQGPYELWHYADIDNGLKASLIEQGERIIRKISRGQYQDAGNQNQPSTPFDFPVNARLEL